MAGNNFTVIAVALDENIEAVIPLAEGITYPVLVDTEHQLAELYAITNVPTVLWIDEHDQIVRPNATEFGCDMFIDFTGISCADHMEQVSDWILNGNLPADASHQVTELSEKEILAHLHFRLAVHAQRNQQEETAQKYFAQAAELAPFDFTIVRAAMPLTGVDPFGPAFFELYQRFADAGLPTHGIERLKQEH